MRSIRTIAVAAAVAGLVVAVAACGGGDEGTGTNTFSDPASGVTTTTINYGLIYDQTGPTAATQVPFGNGFLAAIKAANDKGGVHGRKINVIECDEKYQVAPAIACLKEMIDTNPVIGLTGLNNSSFQAAGLPLVQEGKVPVIGPQSTSKEIVNPFPGWVWATECSYPNQADVAVAYAAKILGTTSFTAVGLGGNVASADAYLGQVKARLDKIGARYLETVHYEYGAPNMDQQAQAIANLKPQIIFTHGGTAQNVTAFKSFEKFGITSTPIIGIFAQQTDAVALASEAVGKNYAAVNCYMNAKMTDVPGVPAMIEAAKAAGYSEDVYNSSDFTNGYVNGLLVVEALTRAGSEPTRQALNDVMPTIQNFDTGGLSPKITFGPNNSVGVTSVVPFKFNYTTNAWEAQGTFEQYENCNSKEFENGNIDAFDVNCIS